MNDGRFSFGWLVLTIVGIVASLSVSANCKKKEFIMGWSDDYEPLMYYDVNEEVTGLDIKFVKEVFRLAKCRLIFKALPWNRVLYEIKHGSVDLTAASSWVEERSQYAYYSEEYRWEQMRIVVRKGEVVRWPLQKLSDIANFDMHLTGLLGAWYGTEFDQIEKNTKYKYLLTLDAETDKHLNRLVNRRTDGVINDVIFLKHQVEKMGITDSVDIHPYKVHDNPLFIIFSRASVSESDVKYLNKVIQQAKQTDFYHALYDRYTAPGTPKVSQE